MNSEMGLSSKLRAAGHSPRRHLCHVHCRFPPPRIVNRQSALNASAGAERVRRCSSRRPFSLPDAR